MSQISHNNIVSLIIISCELSDWNVQSCWLDHKSNSSSETHECEFLMTNNTNPKAWFSLLSNFGQLISMQTWRVCETSLLITAVLSAQLSYCWTFHQHGKNRFTSEWLWISREYSEVWTSVWTNSAQLKNSGGHMLRTKRCWPKGIFLLPKLFRINQAHPRKLRLISANS